MPHNDKSPIYANAALYYHPDGYETSRQDLMGRHAAGEEFLKAFTRNASAETIYCYAGSKKHFDHFGKKITTFAQKRKIGKLIAWRDWPKLADVGCLYMPGPVLDELAWQRRHFDNRAFSLCGITHTTATQKVMDSIGNFLTAPLQPWDALICTSDCVKKTVTTVLTDYADYLSDRFNITAPIKLPLQLPVIPLGVDADAYERTEEQQAAIRSEWRTKLGIHEDETAVLFFGRLSFHAKAHPMPMYIALEQAAQTTGKKFNLVLAGWFPNEGTRSHFIESAKLLCPSLRMTIVDGRHPEVRKNVWFACDIFTSLSDNVQETFGLTPVESMAAGLPVVVSDWNGYKETVSDGVEGFLIPTIMPPNGLGEDLALAHAMGISGYDEYIGIQSQFTSVDVPACAAAYAKLATEPALRNEMGQAGKRRVRAIFDWRVIVRQYEILWSELAKIRHSVDETVKRKIEKPANPLRSDPNAVFSSYPTHTLSPETMVTLPTTTTRDRLLLIRAIPIGNFAGSFLYDNKEMLQLIEDLSESGPVTVGDLCATTPSSRGRALLLTLLWMAKMDLIHLKTQIASHSIEHAKTVVKA